MRKFDLKIHLSRNSLWQFLRSNHSKKVNAVRVEKEKQAWLLSISGAPSRSSLGKILAEFDDGYYLSHNADVMREGVDPFEHYMAFGAKEGRRPTSDFDPEYYEVAHADEIPSGTHAFVHFVLIGKNLGYKSQLKNSITEASTEHYETAKPELDRSSCERNADVEEMHLAIVKTAGASHVSVVTEQAKFVSPGSEYEEFNPRIAAHRAPRAKLLAFYLPQFHTTEENDRWWGTGFTEWRNVARGLPRFEGHVQPRLPRDLGFYDLSRVETIQRQVALARAAGIFGFCFYYYSFGGKRILDTPIELFLKEQSLDFPFALMWANENWTRTWDGQDNSVLISQDYCEKHEYQLIADLVRHFRDRRYIRIGGRPLFIIYRPGSIPSAKATIARWRRCFREKFNTDPLIFMAQGFDDNDPRVYGLDGAIEFPPHKVASGLEAINHTLNILDPKFNGHVVDYDAVIERSLGEVVPAFPLIKGITQGWDNEARRSASGMVLHRASPKKYEMWLRKLVDWSCENPVHGENFVAINAWNEWAEGAYLEPDTHYGSAYLNATARAVVGTPSLSRCRRYKVLLVGHDAYRHGAQLLLKNLAYTMSQQFNLEIGLMICGDGPMMEEYEAVGRCISVERENVDDVATACRAFANEGFQRAIVNTTVGGAVAEQLVQAGIELISLVHEMPNLIREYSLQASAEAIARTSQAILFPAPVVRDGFLEICGPTQGKIVVRPQGLYRTLSPPSSAPHIRRDLGIPENAKVVLNVGYADSRKGFDLFVRVAEALIDQRDDVYFIWVGDCTEDIANWILPDVLSGPASKRFFFPGYVSDIDEYFALSDVFFLSSREDPFPSVVLESMAAGVPVVGFEGSGGCSELISVHGCLVRSNDIKAAASAVLNLLESSPTSAERRANECRDAVRRDFRFDEYCNDLLQLVYPSLRTVSVVVPNYNYEQHLDSRLTSIFTQTYPVFEVIVLDDASDDASVEVIRRCASQAGRRIDLMVNEVNSASAFKQWKKGVEAARGEYIWIAEADDTCDRTFLEVLVDAMEREQAGLGFTDSWQLDSNDAITGASYKAYANSIEPANFDCSFSMPGREFLKKYLSIKNIILNVSGVLWRRDSLVAALNNVEAELAHLKVAGDWCLYAQVCAKNEQIVYESKTLNGHRRHQTSVTRSISDMNHYAEIVKMQEHIGRLVDIDPLTAEKRRAYLAEVVSVLKINRPLVVAAG